MSNIPSSQSGIAITGQEPIASSGWLASSLSRFESTLIRLADRGNAILVKETRQALKSRQFVISFLIVLVASWIATLGGVAVIGPQIYYSAAGAEMLIVYYCILAFPLAVIVPFTAFRSIAAEREDNTYDLLSITTLTSRSIVTGKLLSAALQMLVFLSAVSPCIAFTYLLRGVDARTIALVLGFAVCGSLALSMVGLLLGSMTRVRYTQNILSVGLIILLLGAFAGSIGIVVALIYEGYLLFREREFYWAACGFVLLVATTFGLCHSAAAAQIAFSSENRSSALRWWMMAQTAGLIGWLVAAMYAFEQGGPAATDIVFIGGCIAGPYWFLMGAMTSSEWPILSTRVQRSLPTSTLGRSVLTWFNPGPATGYMFVVANVTALAALGLAATYFDESARTISPREDCRVFCVLLWAYIVAYLGLGRLIVTLVRRVAFVPLVGGFLIQLLFLLLGVGGPIIVQMAATRFRYAGGYSLTHMFNPFWTIAELIDRDLDDKTVLTLLIVLPTVAAGVVFLNLRGIAAEIARRRISAPVRVVQDEAELHPEPAPLPTNPWAAEDIAPKEHGGI